MGISAILGETAMGTLGASCCKAQAVKNDNSTMKRLLEMTGLKSIEEMAITDAVATVNQVAKIRPEWFQREENNKRKRNAPERLGIDTPDSEKNDVSFVPPDGYNEDFPTMISEEIEESNALIGDVWRLAVRKILSDYAKKLNKVRNNFRYKHKFEEIWMLATQACNDGGVTNVSKILMVYREACKDHLSSFEVQERRLKHLTVTRPLRINKVCKISPPIWGKRKSVAAKKFKLICDPAKHGNGIDGFFCAICPKKVEIYDKTCDYGQCLQCFKKAHIECLNRLFLKEDFNCSDVRRPLRDIGVEHSTSSAVTDKPRRPDASCLVCGDSMNDANDCVKCSIENCGYGVHEACIALLGQVKEIDISSSTFTCSDVSRYIKPSEITKYLNGDELTQKNVKNIILRRNTIKVGNYTPKRKRYENPDITCEHCGETVAINEENHLLSYCRARHAGTPVPSRDYDYVIARFKRIKRMALRDYPP